ncbi:MAG: 5,6-dimethylbenzimidazole synthase [Rhodospirillales bacterium]
MTKRDAAAETHPAEPPAFDAAFRVGLEDLIRWRRDVRRFRTDPLPPGLLEKLLEIAALSPSVGNAQPWRFVRVTSPERRAAVRADFEERNADALNDYSGEKAKLYATLKLSGLSDAPEHLAVYCEEDTDLGHGLGRQTMPETLRYSVVGAIQTLWLAARAQGVGIGWVSILDPENVRRILDVPASWSLVGYLCIGWPVEEHLDPELERHGWQAREDVSRFIVER